MTITVQQLIDILNEVENKETPVVLYTDHGQTPMKLTGYGEGFVEDINEHMMEEIDPEDAEEYDTPVFVLEAM